MPIRTEIAIHGFLASEPRLTYTDKGEARMYARVGRDRFERTEGGEYVQLDPEFHNLLMWGKSAERTVDIMAKGDRFIAEGRVVQHERVVDGNTEVEEAFVASRLGPDLNVMNVTVRRRREAAATAGAPVLGEAAAEAIAARPARKAARQAVAARESRLPAPSSGSGKRRGARAARAAGAEPEVVGP